MKIKVFDDAYHAGHAAGQHAAKLIQEAIEDVGGANIVLATGTSQLDTLNYLVKEKNIDWAKVTMFHLDEYIGLPITHPASFKKYLQERFLQKVPTLKAAYLINGEGDPAIECDRLSDLIRRHPIDVTLVGIGENGHLAFNDPPADFETEQPYIVVELDAACRKQQVNEGWFASMDKVPAKAISMSVKQILKSKNIVCTAPESRKANAVKNTVEQKVSNLYPASILQRHSNCTLYLDRLSSASLAPGIIAKTRSFHDN